MRGYNPDRYKKPSVTVDIAICQIRDGIFKVLLIKRKNSPYKGMWAIPGGFLQVDARETLEQTAARELMEETGLKGIYFEQLKTYGDPDRDPRMRIITVAYYALMPTGMGLEPRAGDDAAEVQWFSFQDLPKLAFDHDIILQDVRDRIKGKLNYAPIIFNMVSEQFLWSELQAVYEAISGEKYEDGNFRRFMKYRFDIRPGTKLRQGKLGRPGRLFRYRGIKRAR